MGSLRNISPIISRYVRDSFKFYETDLQQDKDVILFQVEIHIEQIVYGPGVAGAVLQTPL